MVHCYKNGGYHIVLDVNSGSVHVVDRAVYDMIPVCEKAYEKKCRMHSSGSEKESCKAGDKEGGRCDGDFSAMREAVFSDTALQEKYDRKTLEEALSEIEELVAQELLFSEDIYEEYVDGFQDRETVVKALCLNIAHDCNLRCSYCFADEGQYHGGKRGLMSLEVGKAALDFLMDHSGNRRNLEVDFFGGEPLMNWEVVKNIVAYGRELEKKNDKRFRFTLTTNGVLLNDEILEFANREMANLVLSIDGRREVHDRMRPFPGRRGSSYDTIVPKFLKAANSRNQQNYFVRGTFTRYNLDFSKDVEELANLGFQQISVEPVVAKPEDDYALREEDLPTLFEEYDQLAQLLLKRHREGRDFHFFHFDIDLTGGPCVAKRLSGCGSGCEYLGVTPWGELYPCHQFVGNEKFILGDVFHGVNRTDLVGEFKACNVYTKKECRNCFARYYCSGGCAANAYNFTGDINGTYSIGCELQRKRVECAIMIQAALAEEDSSPNEKADESE